MLKEIEPVILEMATGYNEIVAKVQDSSRSSQSSAEGQETEHLFFKALCRSALGEGITRSGVNILSQQLACLSKSVGNSQTVAEADDRVLVDDASGEYMALKEARERIVPERIVHIILGGAGPELLADVVLASYLLETKLATKVVLQPKAIPFGTESTADDVKTLLDFLVASSEQSTQQSPDIRHMHCLNIQQRFQTHLDQGKIIIRPNTVWSNPITGRYLGSRYPELYEELKTAELVIVKGDFLYRKLLADVSTWASSTLS